MQVLQLENRSGTHWLYNSRRGIIGEPDAMLDAFIIEEIKRRERVRQEDGRPHIEIPVPTRDERPPRKTDKEDEDQPQRNVVIVDV